MSEDGKEILDRLYNYSKILSSEAESIHPRDICNIFASFNIAVLAIKTDICEKGERNQEEVDYVYKAANEGLDSIEFILKP